MISQNIDSLRKTLIELKLDGYAIPKNDQYFSEFDFQLVQSQLELNCPQFG